MNPYFRVAVSSVGGERGMHSWKGTQRAPSAVFPKLSGGYKGGYYPLN